MVKIFVFVLSPLNFYDAWAMEITTDQALHKGITAHKAGDLQEAERCYRAILLSQPNHPDANHNLGLIAVSVGKGSSALPLFKAALETNPKIEQFWLSYIEALIKEEQFVNASKFLDEAKKHGMINEKFNALEARLIAVSDRETINVGAPPKIQLDRLLHYYQNGQFGDAERLAESLTKTFPAAPFAWKILAAVYQQTGKNREALNINEKTVALSPFDAEAHNNFGVTLEEMNKSEMAQMSYKRAIVLKPDFVEAQNNLAVIVEELGKFKQGVKLYTAALIIKPGHHKATENLNAILTRYQPAKAFVHPIVEVNRRLREINLRYGSSNRLTRKRIISIIDQAVEILGENAVDVETDSSQTYRQSSYDLNCERHMSIFNKHNIIPEYCFGCYKVQVEPATVLELLYLFIIFDQLELGQNNTRKCMVEFRPYVSGFYKGYIYCQGLEEASEISGKLDVLMKKHIRNDISCQIKRGCSEYPISFPLFKEINMSGEQPMNYLPEWKSIEIRHDQKFPSKARENVYPTMRGLSLKDIQIIQNWLSYAEGLGDKSISGLKANRTINSYFQNIALERIKKYPYTGGLQ